MNVNIVAIACVFMSVCAAIPFIPRGEKFGQGRILLVWMLAGAVGFLVSNTLAALFLIALLFLAVSQIGSVKRVYLYLGVFTALPIGFHEYIPFPGLNYLIDMQYAKVATIVILGPVFLSVLMKPAPKTFRGVDRFLLAFVLMTGIMSIRDVSFTSMLRTTLDQFLLIYVPYLAITRTLTKQEHFTGAIKAIFVSILVYAMIALISTARDWNFYASFGGEMGYKAYADFRNGFLRITATLNPALLGLMMGIGLSSAMFMQRLKAHPRYFLYGFMIVFSFILFVTGARGGWLSGIIAVSFYLLFSRLNRVGRRLLVVSCIAGVVSIITLIAQDSSLISDQYGTVNYRAELLRTSFGQIAERPLFGSVDFLDSPRYAHLIQGEGIVDLVNAYLQVTLYYGLVGLALFLGAHLSCVRGGMKLINAMQSKGVRDGGNDAAFRMICLLLAAELAYLALLATISAGTYIPHYGYVLMGLIVAQVRVQLPVYSPKARREIGSLDSDEPIGANAQEPGLAPLPNA
ncbi:MAG: O-antigen ligase family protein [Marinicaulis sp.]|nr:O-antigen ligase family protein [Marinicaulis sp.]